MRYALTFVALLFSVRHIGIRLLPILNGFMAKHVCSAIFVSRRALAEVRNSELRIRLFRLPAIEIDLAQKWVQVSLWGLGARAAFYHAERGCILCKQSPLPGSRSTAQHRLALQRTEILQPKENFPVDFSPDITSWMETQPAPTLAVCALHRDRIIAEQYRPGISPDTSLPGWSMAKSVMNALVGILVKQGRLDLHEPLPARLWQGAQTGRTNITMHHLLQMSSGLSWTERYWWSSDVTNMLFNSEDVSHSITTKPCRAQPGRRFQYASGTTNAISKALRYLLGDEYPAFPYQYLFEPLGMHTALMETDAAGHFVGSSFMLASARDWSKFGLLYLQDGMWNGENILPQGWVAYTRSPAPAAPAREYGAHFWLNLGEEEQPETRKMPNVSADVYYASGFGGQRLFIVPTYDLVIVRLGAAHFTEPDFNLLLSHFLAEFEKNKRKF